MKKSEIIRYLNEQPLDMKHIERNAKSENISVRKYLTAYIKNYFEASRYTANKVVDYLLF
jgi:hypothetical protein